MNELNAHLISIALALGWIALMLTLMLLHMTTGWPA